MSEGLERLLGTCSAWLDGVKRHQIREVLFHAVIDGRVYSVSVLVLSDGTKSARVFDQDIGECVLDAPESEWVVAA